MVREMDVDESGSIDSGEFLRYMLVKMGKVQDSDIEKVLSMFDALDTYGSGAIDLDDIRADQARRGGYTPPQKPVPSFIASAQADAAAALNRAGDSAEGSWTRGVSNCLKELQKPILG